MGKVEKVIVLSVLFLVALILVVTVTVDDPLDKAKVVEAGGKQGTPSVAQAPTTPPPSAQPMLSTTIASNQPAAAATPSSATQPGAQAPVTPPAAQPLAGAPNAAAAPPVATLPPGALLKKTDGLQDSWFSDLKLYTWKEGDTWRGLAHTYYGDWQRLDVLKRHNEGRMNVATGETVFIPVFADERGKAAEAARVANAGAVGTLLNIDATPAKSTSAKSSPVMAAASPSAAPVGGKKLHVVANGESLWKIAKSELGDGNRWKEIYDANRDVLDKPESIRKGMRLRIP